MISPFQTPSFIDDGINYNPDDLSQFGDSDPSQPSSLSQIGTGDAIDYNAGMGSDPGSAAPLGEQAYKAPSPALDAAREYAKQSLGSDAPQYDEYGFKNRDYQDPSDPTEAYTQANATLNKHLASGTGYGAGMDQYMDALGNPNVDSFGPGSSLSGGSSTIPMGAWGLPPSSTNNYGSQMPLTDQYTRMVQTELAKKTPSFKRRLLGTLASMTPVVGGVLGQQIIDPNSYGDQRKLALARLGAQNEEHALDIQSKIANRGDVLAHRDYTQTLKQIALDDARARAQAAEDDRRARLGAAATAQGLQIMPEQGPDQTLTLPQPPPPPEAPPDLASPEIPAGIGPAAGPVGTGLNQPPPSALAPFIAPRMPQVPQQSIMVTPPSGVAPPGMQRLTPAQERVLEIQSGQMGVVNTPAKQAQEAAEARRQVAQEGNIPTPDEWLKTYPKLPPSLPPAVFEALAKDLKAPAEGEIARTDVQMIGGVPHTIGFDKTGKKVADLGPHYEKPNSTVINMATVEKGAKEWARTLLENPDAVSEVPTNIKSQVAQEFRALSGLPMPKALPGSVVTQELAARNALDGANFIREAIKKPEIQQRLGAILGRLGNVEQDIGATAGLSPQDAQLAQELRTRMRYFVFQEGKAVLGGRLPQQLMSELEKSSPNVKMDAGTLRGAIDGATGNAQSILENAEKERFGGKSRTALQRGITAPTASQAQPLTPQEAQVYLQKSGWTGGKPTKAQKDAAAALAAKDGRSF